MRRIACLILVVASLLASRANAQVLGMDGQALQGTLVCKGLGHTQLGAATGLYIVLNTSAGQITGGELGEHAANGAFCIYSIGSSSTNTIDSYNVGHWSLALTPLNPGPQPPFGAGGCRPTTETFEYNGLNHGNTQIEITETDSGVEAGGTCRVEK